MNTVIMHKKISFKIFLSGMFLIAFCSCISLNNGNNRFLAIFPTDADVFGWKVVKKPATVSIKNLRFINNDIEKYRIQKIYSAQYENINDQGYRISSFVCKTDNPVISYSIINNDRTKDFKSLSKTAIFNGNTLIAFKGSYVIILDAEFMDDNIYAAFNDFLFFFNEHIDDDGNIPSEINAFSFEEITFYPGKFNIFSSGYFIYRHEYNGIFTDVYFMLLENEFAAKTEFYNRIRISGKFIIWTSDGIESAFLKTGETYTFMSYEGRSLFSVYDIDGIEAGKALMYELSSKFRKNR